MANNPDGFTWPIGVSGVMRDGAAAQ